MWRRRRRLRRQRSTRSSSRSPRSAAASVAEAKAAEAEDLLAQAAALRSEIAAESACQARRAGRGARGAHGRSEGARARAPPAADQLDGAAVDAPPADARRHARWRRGLRPAQPRVVARAARVPRRVGGEARAARDAVRRGYPLAELWHPSIAASLGLGSALVDGRAPTIPNGGLASFVPFMALAFINAATVEVLTSKHHWFAPLQKQFGRQKALEGTTRAARLRPARLYSVFGKGEEAKKVMRTAEIKNGRTAMIGVLASSARVCAGHPASRRAVCSSPSGWSSRPPSARISTSSSSSRGRTRSTNSRNSTHHYGAITETDDPTSPKGAVFGFPP